MCHHCGKKTSKILKGHGTNHAVRDWVQCSHDECTKNQPSAHVGGQKPCKQTGTGLLNRDANASANILKCLEAMVNGNKRPAYLQLPKPTSS